VRVPDDAARLVVLLGAAGQHSAADSVWYDDLEVVQLAPCAKQETSRGSRQ
jgi:hypothetical protein